MKPINVSKFARIFETLQRQKANKDIDPIHAEKSQDRIDELCNELPHGSGIDSGVKFDSDSSKPDKLIFTFGFHHLNENGYYDGWTEHKILITPTLQYGYEMKITGRNRNMVKDYLYQLFNDVFYFDPNEPIYKPQQTTNV